MRIFNFSKRLNRWKRVEDEMYKVWIGNQSGAILPRFIDFDFKACMKNTKRNYTLRQCENQLGLMKYS